MADKLESTELRLQVETAVRKAEKQARDYYRLDLPDATIDFSLRGRCAGQARVDRHGATGLRINQQLLAENLENFLSATIPHEVAHLVVNWQACNQSRRPRPHGPEWQAVMQCCYNLPPKRCHSYQTTLARVVPRPFLYSCNCREHRLTSIMHRRISRSYQALCKACKAPVRFVAQEIP
ncbi:MAG: SprT family zinc-dependent metalloprotease [Desulfuromonadales bacterium]